MGGVEVSKEVQNKETILQRLQRDFKDPRFSVGFGLLVIVTISSFCLQTAAQ